MIIYSMNKHRFFNINTLPLSILFVCISILIPSYTSVERGFKFGYPLKYFAFYDTITTIRPNESLFGYISIDAGIFIIDVLIVCLILTFIFNIIKHFRARS